MKELEEISLKKDRNFYLLVCILGVLINFIVFSSNGYMMPVKTDYEFQDGIHFGYQDNNEIRFWILSDIIGFENDKMIFKFALGDILIILGLISLIISVVKLRMEARKWK